MRAILVSFLGGFLLFLVSGCGGSDRVEMPTNPTPPPKNPTFESPKTSSSQAAPAVHPLPGGHGNKKP
jgi:hypothetical protein